MFSRSDFLHGLVAGAVSAATPSPSPMPTALEKTIPMHCIENPALPYDRPLQIKLPVLDGPDFHLTDYRGRLVLLNVFATWCNPCQYETPFLVAAAAKYADRGFSVIGIDDRDSDDSVRDFRKRFGITYPIAMDRRGGLTENIELNGKQGIPASLFITPEGFLSCYTIGNFEADDLADRIEKLLAATTPVITPSPSPQPTTKGTV